MSNERKKTPFKGFLLLGVAGLAFFCMLILLFSILDVRRMREQAAEPPPVYTGQQYAPAQEDDEASWEALQPHDSAVYAESVRAGNR